MTQQQQSREFDVSDLSPIPWLGKRKEFDAISGPREGLFDMVLEPSFDLFAVFQSLYLKKKKIENANLQSLGCKTGDEKGRSGWELRRIC